MKYILSSLFLLLTLKLYPQSAEKRVSLSAVTSFTSKQTQANISRIKLILANTDSLTLGYIPAEQGNEIYKVISENEQSGWLDTLIKKRYSHQFSPNGKTLLWVIKTLSITTDTTGQYYFARLKGLVYSNNTTGSYHQLLSVDTTLTGPAGSNYATGIILLLDQLYQTSLSKINEANKPNKQILSNQQTQPSAGRQLSLIDNGEDQTEDVIATAALQSLPVLKEKVLPGIYLTYQAFTQNKPSFNGAIWGEPDNTEPGHVKLYIMHPDSSIQEIKTAWGVCFGGNEVYKYDNSLLIPIEKSGNGFILSRYQEPAIRRNQAMYWRRIATNNWPNDPNPFSRHQTITLKSHQTLTLKNSPQAPVVTRIDPATGALSF